MRPSLRQVLFRSAGLDLNFAGGVFSLNNTRTASPANIPGWSFSRTDTNGTATALDLAGNVIQFATGVPRITNRGILVEESRTNLVLQSRDLTNAAWTKRGTATVTADAGQTRPDGTTGAMLVAGVNSGTNDVFQAVAATALARYEPSFHIKKVSATGALLLSNPGDALLGTWSIDLSLVGSGWERITRSHPAVTITSEFTGTALSTCGLHFRKTASGAISFYVDFSQLELGAFATSPIITTGAAGTRGADVPLITGLTITPPFTVFGEYAVSGNDATNFRRVAGLWNTGETIEHAIYQRHTNNLVRAFVTTDADSTIGTGSTTAVNKVAVRFATNDLTGSLNGAAVTTDSSVAVTTMTRMYVGTSVAATPLLNGYVQRIRVLPFAATDAQLQALTAP
jgi:hypothetical protein